MTATFDWQVALFNPKTSISIQKRHPYTGNLTQNYLGTLKTHVCIVEML